MARAISANALAKLAATHGTEPVNIIGVEWVSGSRSLYADKKVGDIPGRIQEFSTLDNVVSVSGGADSQSISVTLDDTDGSIKAIFDQHDVHKRPVWVYQWFEGLSLDDKFLIFKGQINSPIRWNEGDRAVRFDVVNQIEEKEMGFSPEEGDFPEIPDDLIGKPWPLAFGTVLDMPAIRINKTVTGTTQQGVGIVSGKDEHANISSGTEQNVAAIGVQLAVMSEQISLLNLAGDSWRSVANRSTTPEAAGARQNASEMAKGFQNQANALRKQISDTLASLTTVESNIVSKRQEEVAQMEQGEGPSVINILGGEDFPQGTPVTVDIGGGEFTGIFGCQEFRITSRRHPEHESRVAAQLDKVTGTAVVDQTVQRFNGSVNGAFGPISRDAIIIGPPVVRRQRVSQVAQHFWADAGSKVSLLTDLEQFYIVSIVPGTVKAVKAFKRFDGIRRLINVPSDLWEQQTIDFGAIQVEMVKLTKQLSNIPDQGWEDELFVTFESTVGPNTVDIMEYLINTYSDIGIDATSFDAVRAKLDPFPSNFALLDRRQIVDVLRDIAFQARCAIFVQNDQFVLKYLPEEPTSVATVNSSDVDFGTMGVSLTPTEELVTKMVVKWRNTYAEDGERQMVFRHNVAQYGIQEQEFNWFIYNQPDIIRKAATFWLIRLANTWKRVRFQGSLNLLNVETFDAITLSGDVAGHVASGDIKAMVEQADYDSSTHTITFECKLPVKAGQMEPYRFFWPAAVAGDFPADGDFGGGDNIGSGVSGDLPIGSGNLGAQCPDGGGIFIGGPNIAFQGPADRGDPKPADTGFQAQPVLTTGTNFDLIVSPNPDPDLSVSYAPDIPIPTLPSMPQAAGIDINTLPVYDSSSGRVTTLKSVFREIASEGLVIDTDAKFGDDSNTAPFDFEHDDEGGKFGAGTAFLQD